MLTSRFPRAALCVALAAMLGALTSCYDEATNRSGLPGDMVISEMTLDEVELLCRWQRRQFRVDPPDDEFVLSCVEGGEVVGAVFVDPLDYCIWRHFVREPPDGFGCDQSIRLFEDCTLQRARERCDFTGYVACMELGVCHTFP